MCSKHKNPPALKEVQTIVSNDIVSIVDHDYERMKQYLIDHWYDEYIDDIDVNIWSIVSYINNEYISETIKLIGTNSLWDWERYIWDVPDWYSYCDWRDEYYPEDECIRCELYSTVEHEDDVVQIDNWNYILTDDAQELNNGDYVHQDDAFFCPWCDRYFHNEDSHYSERNEEDYCEDCFSEGAEVHSYGYSPRLEFYGNEDLKFGLEIEVENLNDDFDYEEDETRLRATEDWSLDNGYEIKNHPMSLDYIHDNMQLFEWLTTRLQDKGARIEKSCWLHIHTSRAGYTDDNHIARVRDFFNCVENKRELTLMAGRGENTYARQHGSELKNTKKIPLSEKPWCDVRYSWVNLIPRETVEFRMFTSTLWSDFWIWRVEFLHSVIEYARTHKTMTRRSYMKRLEKRLNTYKKLERLLTLKWLYPCTWITVESTEE